MTNTLIQIFALIFLGFAWSILRPAGLDADRMRQVFTNSVYYLFLPALVLEILWTTKLGASSFRISAAASTGVLLSLLIAWIVCRACRGDRKTTGALMLASAFPNATYMGLPLQESLFGNWTRAVVIQFDLFACFPLLLTIGMMVAGHFGDSGKKVNPLLTMFRVVPLWAAFIAVVLNVGQVPQPEWARGTLKLLSSAVIPLMLMSVGLALGRGLREWKRLYAVIPVAIIQLFFMPVIVWFVAHTTGMRGDELRVVVLEGALPSMVLGIVLSDRYGLNTGMYAAALTLTTVLSIFTLPLWFHWLAG